MSGICGVLGRRGRPVTSSELNPVLQRLVPLGPHGTASWVAPAGGPAMAVGVARRLVAGDGNDRQPIVVAGGRVAVVADAVLDNRAELARRLGPDAGPRAPDVELVAAAYLRWGERMLDHLSGAFALAVADAGRGAVLVARDQLGWRPLHVHAGTDRIAFASTALAVTGFAGVAAEIDDVRFREYLGLAMASERSWVRGVVPVPSGSFRWLDGTDRPARRYWDLPRRPEVGVPFSEHAERLRAALDAAVAARLQRPGGGVGVLLSGGLDSTAVAASAAVQRAPAPVHTYTSVPPPGWAGPVGGTDADEGPLARVLAGAHPNLRPTLLDVRGVAVFGGYDELFAAGATPPRNPCNVIWLHALTRAAAADGVGLLLTGAVGNMAFSADGPRWLVALLARGHLRSAAAELRAWAACSGQSPARAGATNVGWWLLPGAARWRVRALRRGAEGEPARFARASSLRPDRRDGLGLARHLATEDHSPAVVARRVGPVCSAVLGAQAEFLAALDARWGLRTEDPTGDLRVLEVCARQPEWVRRRDGVTRAAARAAMAGRVPDDIRLRTRRGAQLPDWADRLADAAAELAVELEQLRDHPPSRRAVDVDRLGALVRDLEPAPGPADGAAVDYRQALLRAALASRYVRWFEREAQRPAGARPRSAEALPAPCPRHPPAGCW